MHVFSFFAIHVDQQCCHHQVFFLSWYTAKFYSPLSFVIVINLTEIENYNPKCITLNANEIGTIRCFPFFNFEYIVVFNFLFLFCIYVTLVDRWNST
jgi:hypothetical protein